MNLDNEIKIRYEHFLNFVPKVMEFLTITQEEADLDIVYKGEIDLVTKADKGSEERIIREIEKTFPLDSILGEEGTDKKGVPYSNGSSILLTELSIILIDSLCIALVSVWKIRKVRKSLWGLFLFLQ